MSRATAVVVDPYSSGTKYASALMRAGFSPVAVRSHPRPARDFTATFCQQDFDDGFEEEESGVDGVLRELVRRNVVAVLPGAESGVRLADALATHLTPGLANDPGLATARRHRGLMQQAVARHGLPVIPTLTIRDPQEAVEALERPEFAGRSLVVKPATAVSTDGVTLVEAGQPWQPAVVGLLGRRNAVGLVNEEVVVQPRVHGTEYAVNTFSHNGRHTITDICRYNKVSNAGHFAVYRDVEFLRADDSGHDELTDYARRALDAVGFRFGPAHTEIMLTADGLRLMEVNSRVAGSGMAAAAVLATGDNGMRMTVQHLLGKRNFADTYELVRTVRVAMFVAPGSGTVRNIEVLDEIRSLPTCRALVLNVGNGDRVSATSDLLSSTRFGWALFADTDSRAVDRDHVRARKCEERLRIQA
ncbi:ATP-grasp domain-containing protein [Amycolatopsis sp. lyj-23]|uniref:ATP-grasp domain-containing protein n=1 Tax=Amycolatopsis sp. lyj-23 TaxID=2789283 RepID=UPI0039795575